MSPDSSRPQRVILVFTKNSKSFQINQWYYPSCKNLDILILNSLLSSLEKGGRTFFFFFFNDALSSVQFSSVTQLCPTLCDPMNCSTPGLPVYHQFPEFTQTHIHRVSDAIQPSSFSSPSPSPLLLLPPIPPSIRVFSNESTLCMRQPQYWSFSFSIIPSKEIPGLISFRMDWLDLLAVQGTLKGLLQHHSSKASILQCSAFFTVQLSHPYNPLDYSYSQH